MDVCTVQLQCEGGVSGYHTRGGRDAMSRRALDQSSYWWDMRSGRRCRKPTLFFFLWSSRESLSSASSPCRSETCFSFSDNLTDDSITTHYKHYYVAKCPSKWKRTWKICILYVIIQYAILLTQSEALGLALLYGTAIWGGEQDSIKTRTEWEFYLLWPT